MAESSDFFFSMPSSSSSSPPLLPPTPQKHRRKRSKFIKFLLPNPQHCTIPKPKPYPNPQLRHCCPECFKEFSSQKALYGHMRCHPDRDYRGMIRKPKYPFSTSPSPSSSSSPIQHKSSNSSLMTVEDHEVASCLLLLSRTAELENSSDCSFECSGCKKVFGSHQALGGHRASHKNVKGCFASNAGCAIFDNHDFMDNGDYPNSSRNNAGDDDDGEKKEMGMGNLGHKCSICLRVFPSGQALGGHKRCHWEKVEADSADDANFVDLNYPADDSSFSLDLRLSL